MCCYVNISYPLLLSLHSWSWDPFPGVRAHAFTTSKEVVKNTPCFGGFRNDNNDNDNDKDNDKWRFMFTIIIIIPNRQSHST